jgi:pilus assembly protein CpaB
MKNQSLILLVVAVGCGLVAMLGVKQVISQKPTDTVETIQVLSAISEIHPGIPLDEMNTKFVDMAVTSVPEGAVTDLQEIKERFLKVPVMPGDWILKSKLTESRGAEASIPPGMAAVSIPVDTTTSHSGMLLPGNKIDLLLTFSDKFSGMDVQKTITVLQFVEVFAVDNRVYGVDKGGEAQAKNITLLVTPEQGKAVTLAGKIGTLSTMMRARNGAEANGTTEISEEWLTSSFMGSNHDAPSVMDLREVYSSEESAESTADAVGVDPPLNPDEVPSLSELVDQELNRTKDPGGSGPVLEPAAGGKNTWTMEIYEGEKLRLESVTIADAVEKESSRTTGSWSMWDILKKN